MATGLGIDLGGSAVKVVKLRGRGGNWQVLHAARVAESAPPPAPLAKPSDPLPPRQLPSGTRGALAAAGLAGRGALGLTGRDLMVKYVATPPVPPWKLRLMMDLEIKGTSGAEVCGGYARLNIPGELTREMVSLVAVAKTAYVEAQMGLARAAGLAAEWCCPGAIALFNAFVASGQFKPGETVAVLDLGRDSLELVIQRDGVLYFARSAPGGARRFIEAVDGIFNLGYERSEQYLRGRAAIQAGSAASLEPSQIKVSGALAEVADGLAAAVRSALMFCKAQTKVSKLDLERLVLSGGGARLKGLAEYLKEKLKIPVDVLDPASRLDLSRLPRDQAALLDGPAAAEFAVAIGLAQVAADESAFCIPVLPDRVVRSRRFWRGTVWAIAAAALLVGTLAIDAVTAARRRGAAEAEKSRLDDAGKELGAKSKRVQDERAENQKIEAQKNLLCSPAQRNLPVLWFLTLLREATPQYVTIERLNAAGPDDASEPGVDEVVVKVSGRVDSGQVSGVHDALKEYMDRLRAGRKNQPKGQPFKVRDVEITTERSELDKPAAGDARKPFTFTARLATLGVSIETEQAVETGGALPTAPTLAPVAPERPVEPPLAPPPPPNPEPKTGKPPVVGGDGTGF